MAQWIRQGVVVGLGLVMACSVSAAEEQATSKARVTDAQLAAPAPATAAPAAAPAREESPKEKATKEWQKKLTGTTWILDVRTASGQGKTAQDTVRLTGLELISERFLKDGFPSSNYALTALDDGAAQIETMQTHPEGGNAFWHLEVRGETLQGRVVKQTKDGAVEELSVAGRPAQAPPAGAATEAPKPSKRQR